MWRHEPPLDPSADQGRRLLRDELSALVYADQRTPQERLLDWIAEHLQVAGGAGSGLIGRMLLLLVGLAVIGLAVFLLLRLRRGDVLQRGANPAVLVESDLSADDYRARAAEHDRRGHHGSATIDWFRALARSAEERVLLGDGPARTAHEIGTALAGRFPSRADDIDAAAALFDAVLYGGTPSTADDSRRVRDLDRDLARLRPKDANGTRLVPVAPGRWAP